MAFISGRNEKQEQDKMKQDTGKKRQTKEKVFEKGRFYGVGTGPGDAGYLTLKAVGIIGRCPVLAVPCTGTQKTLALSILKEAEILLGEMFEKDGKNIWKLDTKEILYLDFPMCRDEKKRKENYNRLAEEIRKYLDMGQDVCMAVLGDVSLYATSSYLAASLGEKGYEVELCAGVPSFCGAAAVLKKSLTSIDQPLHIIPASVNGLQKQLALPGSKALLKSASHLSDVKKAIGEAGLLNRAEMVKNCGLSGQEIYKRLDGDTGEDSYFTTILIAAEEN